MIGRKSQITQIQEYVLERGGRLVVKSSNGQRSRSEALAEWRSVQAEKGTPSTLPPYWDIDDVDDYGSKPSELYGKATWKIEKFSKINEPELCSNVFEIGGYKWYLVVIPQGGDVSNHLSVCLCVANHDELLPGWSHFAQFTIVVVNKDSTKSKHLDTLHRFCKKEYAWGCQEFMELAKLQEGFIDDSDSLTIKAQVQVIRERVDRPFRCLHSGYRRELVRVYLTNVEQIFWRFVDEKRTTFGNLIGDKAKWESLCAFWIGLDQNTRRQMSREKLDVILKRIVKHFFIEEEVTSALVMDSLYSGLKAVEGETKNKSSKARLADNLELPAPFVTVDEGVFLLVDDMPLLLERAVREPLPLKDEMSPLNPMKGGNVGGEFSVEAIERDERRLSELARHTLEIFVLGQIFSNKIEMSYQEELALKRQEELIREEEAWLIESENKTRKGTTTNKKKSKKKQAKQKKTYGHKNQSDSSEVRKVEEAAAAPISPIREPESHWERNPVSKDRDRVPMQEKSVAVLSSPKQASPVIPPKEASPVIPRKQASHVISPKQASPVNPSKQGSPVNPSKQGSPVIPTKQAYVPQSYKHAIVGSSGFNHPSSQSIGVSTLSPYSYLSPISVSNQSGFPVNVVSSDVSSGGFLSIGGSTSDSSSSGNHGMNHYNKPVVASTKPNDVQMGKVAESLMTDEYPHLEMINDLLEDGHGMMGSRVYHVQQTSNNQYMNHGDANLEISSRSRSYSYGGFHQSYGEYMPHASSSSSSPYRWNQWE